MNDSPAEGDALFAQYHRLVRERYARALDAERFSAVLIHSGSPPLVFADDQSYPFRANAAFKIGRASCRERV